MTKELVEAAFGILLAIYTMDNYLGIGIYLSKKAYEQCTQKVEINTFREGK